MLGIVVMVTGIVTAIVLSFKYVSGGDKRGCGVPRVSPGLVGARGGLGGSRVWCQPWQKQLACREEGASASASAASPREPGAGRSCPALPAACRRPGQPAPVSFPAQVPWLHMLYAAIGAIAFTLVS